MILKELIEWLEGQDKKDVIQDGFGSPHSDRGYYENLAFDPVPETTIGEMLKHAKSAKGEVFIGWKGGNFKMTEYTEVFIGGHGRCGEPINSANLKLWELLANGNAHTPR